MSHFFAYMFRMKQIHRWGLMRNTQSENDLEHALQVAMIAHVLATLHNVRYGGCVNADAVATLALYHDAGEVITGDLATPIKYFNPEIKQAFQHLERIAEERLLTMLPKDLQSIYAPLLLQDRADERIRWVKAADKIAAYLKCVEEIKVGNGEFEKARDATRRVIDDMQEAEVADFMREFAPSFMLTLDELN
ncbi:MAG: 5'-deoxynucleotidase [Clostridia bacterium]